MASAGVDKMHTARLALDESNQCVSIPVPEWAAGARVQGVNVGTAVWSAGTATVKWNNLGGKSGVDFASAVALTAASPGTPEVLDVRGVRALLIAAGTTEAAVTLDLVVVFSDKH